MRYKQNIALVPASAGLTGLYLFRANSIHDPDFSGLGHQPYGHDTYQSIYNHYKVVKSTITVTPTVQANGLFGITLTDDSTVQGDFDTIAEIKNTKMAAVTTGAGNNSSVVQQYKLTDVFSPTIDGLGANFGQNPSEQSFFHVWFEERNNTTAPTGLTAVVTITYEVDMWELRDLGQS